MSEANVLFAGESWLTYSVHIKGVDYFVSSEYEEGTQWVKSALEADGISVEHIPNHLASARFPNTPEHLGRYQCVILSDIGSNTLLLHPDTTRYSKRTPNRLKLLESYVSGGGGLVMIGGYMTFQGIDGRARYKSTPVEKALPVELLPGDDRVEVPEGFSPTVVDSGHPILNGIPTDWPFMLFYNRVLLKEGASLLLENEGDPILAAWDYGRGRSVAFTPDAAPHGAPPEFLEWEYFPTLWTQAIRWVCHQS
jgi:uncharacterized membrane protein